MPLGFEARSVPIDPEKSKPMFGAHSGPWLEAPNDFAQIRKTCQMTEPSGIGPLEHGRRAAPGSFLIWIILVAVGGAITWGMYGNDVRSILKIPPAGAPEHRVSTRTDQKSTAINADEIVGLVKDLQASQQRTADDVRTALQFLTSEQAATKTLSNAVAALQAKVDALHSSTAATEEACTLSDAKAFSTTATFRQPGAGPARTGAGGAG
jgi:hypothetical protein